MTILLKIIKTIFLFVLLTILTQIGGLVYLIYRGIIFLVKKKNQHAALLKFKRLLFLGGYLLTTLLIIPPIAKQFGRVPLPYFATGKQPIQPLTIGTCLLNRHYVRPQLKNRILLIANDLKKEFPVIRLNYLDANFPFWNGFPLLPHLSHNDGRKLDIAFVYKDKETGRRLTTSPSFYGYGVFEGPKKGETDQPNICRKKGNWQYGFMEKVTPQWYKKSRVVDVKSTKRLLQLLAKDKAIQKIFLEPHLKTRWGLTNYGKIRYHGCHAVRHDDHIHVQIR